MKKAQKYGVSVVLGTVGEEGSYVLYKDKFLYTKAVLAEDVIDTMGAGDSYFAAFLSDMLKNSPQHKILDGSDEQMYVKIQNVRKRRCIWIWSTNYRKNRNLGRYKYETRYV